MNDAHRVFNKDSILRIMSDGSMTTTPTGIREEMKGGGKEIGPTDNDAAKM